MLKSTTSENMVIFAFFGYFEGFRPIISNKKLCSCLLLPEKKILSYISLFYHKFENSSFLTFSTFSDPHTRGKFQIGMYKSMYLRGSTIRYAKSPNSPPPTVISCTPSLPYQFTISKFVLAYSYACYFHSFLKIVEPLYIQLP